MTMFRNRCLPHYTYISYELRPTNVQDCINVGLGIGIFKRKKDCAPCFLSCTERDSHDRLFREPVQLRAGGSSVMPTHKGGEIERLGFLRRAFVIFHGLLLVMCGCALIAQLSLACLISSRMGGCMQGKYGATSLHRNFYEPYQP